MKCIVRLLLGVALAGLLVGGEAPPTGVSDPATPAVTASAVVGGRAVKPGETLASIAEEEYGHKHYALVLAKLNKLAGKSASSLKAGQIIRAPALREMLFTEGLTESAGPAIDEVLEARFELMRLRGDVVRALTPGNSKAPVKVPPELKAELRKAALRLERAADELAALGQNQDSPVRMRQRLQEIAKLTRHLADGAKAVAGPDAKSPHAAMHLLFAQTWVRGIMWARGEDGRG